MSSSETQSQSGLRSLKRDFSNNDDVIFWPPSPERSKKEAIRDLTAHEKRLKAIQQGLDSCNYAAKPLISSNISNIAAPKKRTSDHFKEEQTQAQQPPKKRILPPSFQSSSKSTLTSTASTAPSTSTSSFARTNSYKTAPIPDSSAKPAKVFLSPEQQQILKLVEQGTSIFYTGSAGTGKSVLLREIIKSLRRSNSKSPDAVAITASTGIAACNIGGVTIHSFAGIGLGVETAEQLAVKIRKNKKASGRWMRVKVLIIDEVSMVDGDLFDKLARVGSILRKKPEPFGGIQIVVTGDFFQLPPVMKQGTPKFAFEAQLWSSAIQRTFNLTKVFRQTDQEFIDMLNEMRFGKLTPKSITKFKTLAREIHYEDGMGATELFPRREDVDRANTTRMTRLGTESRTYRSSDGGTITDEAQREKMLANFMAPGVIQLKIDSQVMLIKNMDEQLVNGSIGKVVRFQDPTDGTAGDPQGKKKAGGLVWPVVAFPIVGGLVRETMVQPETFKVELPNGEVQVSRTQLPLILAWAMSIHKSQGQTLDRVKVDCGRIFEKGQAYVALSRATSLDGLQVLNFDAGKVNAHPKVVEWCKTLETIS